MLCFWVCKIWWHACHKDTEGNGVIAPLSVNLGTRWRRVTSVMLLPTYHKKRTTVSIKYEVGCIAGPVGICLEMEKSLSTIWILICSPVPPSTNYITLAPAVRYMVPNNFKDRGTFIFMGKLTLASEEVTFLHNNGELHNQQHSVTPQRTQILTYATVKASNLPNSYPSKILP
jgi:hypothetical protein